MRVHFQANGLNSNYICQYKLYYKAEQVSLLANYHSFASLDSEGFVYLTAQHVVSTDKCMDSRSCQQIPVTRWHHSAGGTVPTSLFCMIHFLKSSCGGEKVTMGGRRDWKKSLMKRVQGQGAPPIILGMIHV